MAAAAALAPYCHPKLQATPTPRFVEIPIPVPEFTHLSDAEQFLAKIAALTARGELDIQTALELSTLAKNWIESQYAREELAIKQINAGAADHEQIIRIEGGLPALPGSNITMPVLNGHAVQDNLIAPPEPVVPPSSVDLQNDSVVPQSNDSVPAQSNDSIPSNESTNGHGPEPNDGAAPINGGSATAPLEPTAAPAVLNEPAAANITNAHGPSASDSCPETIAE